MFDPVRVGGGVTPCVVTAGNGSGKLMFTLIGVGFKREERVSSGKKEGS